MMTVALLRKNTREKGPTIRHITKYYNLNENKK